MDHNDDKSSQTNGASIDSELFNTTSKPVVSLRPSPPAPPNLQQLSKKLRFEFYFENIEYLRQQLVAIVEAKGKLALEEHEDILATWKANDMHGHDESQSIGQTKPAFNNPQADPPFHLHIPFQKGSKLVIVC